MNKCLSHNILCPYANHARETGCEALSKEDCNRWRREYKKGISDAYPAKLVSIVADQRERKPEKLGLDLIAE